MTHADFNAMDERVKTYSIVKRGVFLAIRQEPLFFVTLYAINGFYVETFYYIKTREVVKYRCFNTTHFLDPYLQDINIDALFA